MTSGSSERHPVEPIRPAFAFECIIGAGHLRTGKPCQDDVGVLAAGDVVAVAVADGHGTSKHAEVGARLAVQVALTSLLRFDEDLGERALNLGEVQNFAEHPLRVQIVREWTARVRAKGGEDVPLVDYGSTLLFALSTPRFLLLGQLGDGDLLLVSEDGSVSVPLPADPSAFADETPSLCLPEAWSSLRVRVLPAPAREALLLMATDGYSKSYATDAVFHQIGPDYLELVREDGVHGLQPHLRGFLEQVTTQGAGDDIALALMHWPPQQHDAEQPAIEASLAADPSGEADASAVMEEPQQSQDSPSTTDDFEQDRQVAIEDQQAPEAAPEAVNYGLTGETEAEPPAGESDDERATEDL